MSGLMQATPLHNNPLFPICNFTPRNSIPRKLKYSKKKSHQQRKTRKLNRSFPKSSPTPVLTNTRPPKFQTKLEALDAVVENLEASAKNGIVVDDTKTLASLLETCFRLQAVDHGIRVHRLIPPKILRKNVGVASKLLRLYAGNGRVGDAHQLFDEMANRNEYAFAWNALISGYADSGQYEDALALFFQMEEEGVEPDRFTFPRALKACSGIGSIHVGEEIHRRVVRHGLFDDVFVLNGLIDMYGKCGDIMTATKVFDLIKCKDMVSWNSMITGYFHHGLQVNAITVFQQMVKAGFQPDEITLSAILSGVSSLRLVAGQIHGWVTRRGIEWSLPIANSLISLYSSHGMLDQVRWLFSRMPEKDIVSWNSILSAHSKDNQALTYFQAMENSSTFPDAITFVSLLSTCANLGLTKDGERLFSLMQERYGIAPSMEHYACIVNLYGRAGLIKDAYEIVVQRMEFEAGPTVWGALLYACWVCGNVQVGEAAGYKLFDLEPDNGHNFELLMKLYESTGRLEDKERVKRMMIDRGLDL